MYRGRRRRVVLELFQAMEGTKDFDHPIVIAYSQYVIDV